MISLPERKWVKRLHYYGVYWYEIVSSHVHYIFLTSVAVKVWKKIWWMQITRHSNHLQTWSFEHNNGRATSEGSLLVCSKDSMTHNLHLLTTQKTFRVMQKGTCNLIHAAPTVSMYFVLPWNKDNFNVFLPLPCGLNTLPWDVDTCMEIGWYRRFLLLNLAEICDFTLSDMCICDQAIQKNKSVPNMSYV